MTPACTAGYYLYNETCNACPLGSTCPLGTTLEQLPLDRGYYRQNIYSTDLRLCPDGLKETSGCQGGTGDPCAASLQAQA